MPNLNSIHEELSQKLKKLSLPRNAVGRKITSKVPIVREGKTVSDAVTQIFEHIKDFDSINYVYVLSKKSKLVGVVSIKELFSTQASEIIDKIMTKKLITATPKKDQERAAHMALEANLKAIPVIDEEEKLLGVLVSDAILSILVQESHNDFLKMAGVVGRHNLTSANVAVLKSFSHRIPWILIGLCGGLITASVITTFETTLSQNLILASFIPLVAYIANAVANQAQTIFIRDLTIDSKIIFLKYLLKQIATVFLIGLACWGALLLTTALIWKESFLGFVVGLSIFTAIISSTILALTIPQLLKSLKLDPATGSGPFSTMFQDLLSITIYFAIASSLL